MSRANSDKVVELLDQAIADGNNGSPSDFQRWKESSRTALRLALGKDDDAIERFDKIRYSLSMSTERTPRSAHDEAKRSGIRRGIAMLEAARTEVEVTDSSAPAVDVTGLHRWVAGSAASLWEGGHHRQAVEEACRTIEVQLRAKLGIDGDTLTNLVTHAFNPKPPKSGEVRLRFTQFTEGTTDWTNAHEGAMSFGRGCAMRIRNLYTHGQEPSEQEALEALAALSLLARWVDDASPVPTP